MMQGRGYGSAPLLHALEPIDRDGHLAYLESTNPANVPLYRRHGFEVVGTMQVDDAPPMIRDDSDGSAGPLTARAAVEHGP
jgi:GNAT superfamily N-acetyltransferase